jgi:hypothetical protein
METIDVNQLIMILKNPDVTAEDLSLVRYYVTENELVVIIRYKTIDLKCVIDKLSLVDNEIPNINTIEGFITTYLGSPLTTIKLLGEEKEKKSVKLNVTAKED